MKSRKRDIASVWDMVRAIQYAQNFTEGFTFDEYVNDLRTVSAVERQLEILGEATSRISEEFREAHPSIDWRRIVGLRNVVIHRYDDVDQGIVWNIVQSDLTPLLDQLNALLSSLPD
ncbi:MAG: DUF86 domain-containing protein [Cyanobacteria bacterium J06638_20]